MNLFHKKTGLLLTLGALFFFSCKNADEILLDPDTDPNQKGTYYQENFPISISTFLVDQFSTSSESGGDSYMLFGTYNDPQFGPVTTSSFAEAAARSHKVPASEVEFLSFQIHLDINYTQGDFSTPQKILVHRLEAPIYENKMKRREYGFSSPAIQEGELLLNETIRPDSFNIKKGRYLFNLPQELGLEFFENLKKDNAITSQNTFVSFFKGISLRGDLGNTAVLGANSDSTYIQLSYKSKEDTVNLTFPFTIYHYNKVDINRVAALNPPNTGIVQSSTGVVSKISLQSILSLKAAGKNIAINKATLEITPNEESGIAPPRNLFLIVSGFKTDPEKDNGDSLVVDTGREIVFNSGKDDSISVNSFKVVQADQFYQQQYNNANAFNLRYFPDQKKYIGDISSYIEAVLKDENKRLTTELILYPEAEGHGLNRFFSYSLNRMDLSQIATLNKDLTINKAVIQNDKIKLKIYYTLLD